MSGRTQAVYYRDANGNEPVWQFVRGLAATRPSAADKIQGLIDEHLNNQPTDSPPPAFPISSQVDGELRELRVRFGRTRYRVLYRRSTQLVVLLHVFEKNTGAIPTADIALAKTRFDDFKARMDANPRRPPRAAGRDAP
ncbi:MAG: type II toxin-antitoxin system RelE/ParE family toxin [Actinomycetota bacterium]|nr:type II toxin-antitoxin system RelE/ParE family toxin [Actinomycetota bacterium]